MLRLSRRSLLVAGIVALIAPWTRADDKKDAALPPGVWGLQGGEMKLEFANKNVLKLYPHGTAEVVAIVCNYALKDGRVKAKVTELDGTAKDKIQKVVPLGLEFNFRWKPSGDMAALEDVKGEKVELLKSHLEGKYEKK